MAKLSIRIDFGPGLRLGPGKILLLEEIAAQGSISAAGRAIGMSYKRAWDLVDELNGIFGAAVVESKSGGRKGGGALLTPLGEDIVRRYRALEAQATAAAEAEVLALRQLRATKS